MKNSLLASAVLALSALVSSTQSLAASDIGYWGEFKKYGCYSTTQAKYAAVLWGIPGGYDWETACAVKDASINGQYFDRPVACRNHGGHMWGEFSVNEYCYN